MKTPALSIASKGGGGSSGLGEHPPGLPAPTYALFKRKDSWFFLRGNPGFVRGERYREGPFPEREDARSHAWRDAWNRGVRVCTNKGYL